MPWNREEAVDLRRILAPAGELTRLDNAGYLSREFAAVLHRRAKGARQI